ncbi:histone-lysine N-methyltransferase SETMAR-like protein [Plakobranchus ocellatus]|uniref:Histone-lysine N-methyltransferase SETMAR-like protein n=1 Tax=Plakobranchus ocellatus TaxID=259542 RepID=A0AAV3Z034_9GAST|nr:histone-lysine N-methyltransferase SETMAR-like protein [Plakobranchus ocellatus]
MKTVYGEMWISDCAVRKWVRIFKGEDPRETILRDRKRSGRPLSASVKAHREKVDCMIRANRRVKQKEIANSVGISKERVHHIVTTVLGYGKVSACWVPRQLTKYLKGHHYDNDEEVITDVRKWCRGQSSEFFADGVRQLVKRWRLCVDRDND